MSRVRFPISPISDYQKSIGSQSGAAKRGLASVGRSVHYRRMRLWSDAFEDFGDLPRGCEHASPSLAWDEPPPRARSLALVFEQRGRLRDLEDWRDRDAFAGHFVTHWLVWGLPARAGRLDEGAKPLREGTNDLDVVGYSGPQRVSGPSQHLRRYVFTLIALDEAPELARGATRAEFDVAAEGHVLATATLAAAYRWQCDRRFSRLRDAAARLPGRRGPRRGR